MHRLCNSNDNIDKEYGVNVPRPGCVKVYNLNATTTTCFCNTDKCNMKCVAKDCRIKAVKTMPPKNLKNSSQLPTYPIRVEHCRVECVNPWLDYGTVERTEKTDSEKTYTTSSTTRYRDITDVETTYVVSTDRKLTSKSGSCSSIRNLKRMFSIWIVMIHFIYKIA